MSNKREWHNGTQPQGVSEIIRWELDVTKWGSSPTSPSVTVLCNGADVSAAILSGSPSVSGNIIYFTTHNVEVGRTYRVNTSFGIGFSTEECYGFIVGEE